MTHTFGPSKPKTINSALRHQFRYVIGLQFTIIIILITTFHSVPVRNKPQSVSNAAYNFLGTHCSYEPQLSDTTDCFFEFVSVAVQRLPKFFYSNISSAAFSTAALHQRHINTQHCIYKSLQKLNCEIVHSMHIHR